MRSSSPREGVALNIVQRQLGHANLGTTSIYLRGIDPEEIITAEESGSVTALPLRPGEASAGTAQLTRPSLVLSRALNLTMHTPASARSQHNRGHGRRVFGALGRSAQVAVT
jgi:hypothetical protein